MTATRNKHVHFSAKLHEVAHEVAANHNLGIGMGVVNQLWRHLLPFYLKNKDNLLFAVFIKEIKWSYKKIEC